MASSSYAPKVADHYNNRENYTIDKRLETRSIGTKRFNNWIKAVLISVYASEGNQRALDICGGKGGDLRKWALSKVKSLVFADVAFVSVEQALDRYRKDNSMQYDAAFIAADCCKSGMWNNPKLNVSSPSSVSPSAAPRPPAWFDAVSCQFAFHYSFESEERARGLLHNVSSRLSVGGKFFGTIPDAYKIVKKLRTSGKSEFGNSVVKFVFKETGPLPEFGAEYRFSLVDAVDDCPEFLVHFPTLERLAEDVGLRLVSKLNFHQFFQRYIGLPQYFEHFYKLRAQMPLTDDEWEACGYYLAFCFEKHRSYDAPDSCADDLSAAPLSAPFVQPRTSADQINTYNLDA